MSYSKYKNKKVVVDGHKFDSIKESHRYVELKLLKRAGKIKDLELQPQFELIPTIRTGDDCGRCEVSSYKNSCIFIKKKIIFAKIYRV